MDIDVSTIAENELIRDIFKFKYWEVDDGIDYLVGIYKGREKDGLQEVTTLDGRVYTELEHAKEINELYARHDRVRAIWDHDNKKGRRYFSSTFIKWGLQHREAAKLSWLSDAQLKGLVPNDIDKPKTKPEGELRDSERTILLRIIHGLYLKAFKEPPNKHGLQKQISAFLDSHELHVGENTLGKHLNAAAVVSRRALVSPIPQ